MNETIVPNPHVVNPPIPLEPSSTHRFTTPAAIPQTLVGIIGLVVRGRVGGVILRVTVQVPGMFGKRIDLKFIPSTYRVVVAEEEQTWCFRPEL